MSEPIIADTPDVPATPALSPLFVTSNASIDAFCDALWLEHGLSRNTLDAYRRDLRLFCEWLAQSRNASLDTASEADLTAYSVVRQKDKSTSSNRRLSVFRRYYAWAVREHRATVDPTLRIRSAKQPARFPATLSEAQVEALLGAPDVATPLGLRDRTMLELMYASGLRVTELVTLKTVEVGLNERGTAGAAGRACDGCAVRDQPRRRYDAPAVLEHHQAPCGGGRGACAAFAAYVAARVRDAFAKSRRRSARCATAAWAYRYLDHADLHACGA